MSNEDTSSICKCKCLTIRGEKGERGDKGEKGDCGPPGIAGRIGVPGIQGPRGEVGPLGERGIPGPPGRIGPTGARGEKGDIGWTGPRGVQGMVGMRGEKGERGERGEQGMTGRQGVPGKQGVCNAIVTCNTVIKTSKTNVALLPFDGDKYTLSGMYIVGTGNCILEVEVKDALTDEIILNAQVKMSGHIHVQRFEQFLSIPTTLTALVISCKQDNKSGQITIRTIQLSYETKQ